MAGKAAGFLGEESGATAIEYALIAALVFVVVATALTSYADSLNGIYEFIRTTFVGAVSNAG